MLRAKILVVSFVVFISIMTSCVESSEIRFISPIGAVARSIVPGWGQLYTHNRLKGAVIFLSIGILGGSGLRADATYRDFYNKYQRAFEEGKDLSETDRFYDRSNQYYKLSRFLFYTIAGIWAYSAADAYTDAHIYNARQQVRTLDIDDKRLQQLKLETGLNKVLVPKGYFPFKSLTRGD